MGFKTDFSFDSVCIRGISDGLWCEGKCERRKFTLTPTLTTETTINRAFQADCEGVRVTK